MTFVETPTYQGKASRDYYPFGMVMPGRQFQSRSGYRYGFNGMEKDNEIAGEGNSYTTHFRQLDVRLGRWWSMDPKANALQSPYMSMGGNPIWYNDVLGDTIKTNQEGFNVINEGLNATLGDANPFGFNAEKGFVTFDQEAYKNGDYDKTQKQIIDRFAHLATSDKDVVNVFVVDNDEKIKTSQGVSSLGALQAVGITTNFRAEKSLEPGGDYLKTSQDVFISRKPVNKLGESEPKYFRGLGALHEIGGHAYYDQVGGIILNIPTKNDLVEMFENRVREIFMKSNGKPVGGKAEEHEQ